MKIRNKGMQDGRQVFTAKIRKGHEVEDIDKILKFQENTQGKCRYKIVLDGDFTRREAEQLTERLLVVNSCKNMTSRKENAVHYTNAILQII